MVILVWNPLSKYDFWYRHPGEDQKQLIRIRWQQTDPLANRVLHSLDEYIYCRRQLEYDVRKHLASTSPSLPVAVSGFVLPKEAPAQIGRFWFRHHCFVHDRQGWDGLSGIFNRNIVKFDWKQMPKEALASYPGWSAVNMHICKSWWPPICSTSPEPRPGVC